MSKPSSRMICIVAVLLIPIATSPTPVPGQAGESPKPVADALPSSNAPPAFEVSSVKPNKSGSTGSHSGFSNDRFLATNLSLGSLIQYTAYDVPASRIVGGPSWLNSEMFDIDAKIDGPTLEHLNALDRVQARLEKHEIVQRLLADRFKLAVHWETREFPVYALVVSKNGPRLTATKHPDKGIDADWGNGTLTAKQVSMQDLAQTLTQVLSRELGRDVIDKTGIAGRYDLTLKWTPDNGASAAASDDAQTPADAGPSIFTAIQEQLGLKLESTKAPVKVLVIDHAEIPSAD
ncbi:MAG: TIGR03435 family protein [Acidobacteriaceae bacterium]|jgi:uncharacterized protein (TIGR03435 family)